jgi:hypothetical protein
VCLTQLARCKSPFQEKLRAEVRIRVSLSAQTRPLRLFSPARDEKNLKKSPRARHGGGRSGYKKRQLCRERFPAELSGECRLMAGGEGLDIYTAYDLPAYTYMKVTQPKSKRFGRPTLLTPIFAELKLYLEETLLQADGGRCTASSCTATSAPCAPHSSGSPRRLD